MTCRHCGAALPPASPVGREREFCDDGCRARFHEARRRRQLAVEVAEALRSSPESKAISALIGVGPRYLEALHRALVPAQVAAERASKVVAARRPQKRTGEAIRTSGE